MLLALAGFAISKQATLKGRSCSAALRKRKRRPRKQGKRPRGCGAWQMRCFAHDAPHGLMHILLLEWAKQSSALGVGKGGRRKRENCSGIISEAKQRMIDDSLAAGIAPAPSSRRRLPLKLSKLPLNKAESWKMTGMLRSPALLTAKIAGPEAPQPRVISIKGSAHFLKSACPKSKRERVKADMQVHSSRASHFSSRPHLAED